MEVNNLKYVVCYSGGHSSAIVAIETVRKYGKENVVLLNHDISSNVEHEDIKRFKNEVAEYLGLEITYANHEKWDTMDQFDVCVEAGAFKVGTGKALCTNRLKTKPFQEWMGKHYPVKKGEFREDVVFMYGFDSNEHNRVTRRSQIMGLMGYDTDYPLALWANRTIENIEEIGINRPSVYETFRHANCIGCLKAGKQQWYIVYCLRPDIWEKAKDAEEKIGYSILRNNFMHELEDEFSRMKEIGITPTETVKFQKFWAEAKKKLKNYEISDYTDSIPCECGL